MVGGDLHLAMNLAELAQLLVAAATLVSSLAALVVAVRTGQKTSATHELVNGASDQLNALREAQGFRAGVNAASSAGQSTPAKPAAAERTA